MEKTETLTTTENAPKQQQKKNKPSKSNEVKQDSKRHEIATSPVVYETSKRKRESYCFANVFD